MAKIKRYNEEDGYHNELGFYCPGCGCRHFIHDSKTKNPDVLNEVPRQHIWTFNEDFEKPTISPSILSRSYRKNTDTGKYDIEVDRCHSYITSGKIKFLSDCMHKFAGQELDLPDIE